MLTVVALLWWGGVECDGGGNMSKDEDKPSASLPASYPISFPSAPAPPH